MPASVIPVLDLLGGVVVRGVAGKRDEYRPVESNLCESADPLTVARAIRDHFGFDRFYVADLDSIIQHKLNEHTIRELVDDGFRILLDAGVSGASQIPALMDLGVESVIVGLESQASPDSLAQLARECEVSRMIFSLDLKQGQPLCNNENWSEQNPRMIAELAIGLGFGSLIVLDLAAVGTSQGPMVLELCRELRDQFPSLNLISGGGVSTATDIALFEAVGVDGVLVATALHNGKLDAT